MDTVTAMVILYLVGLAMGIGMTSEYYKDKYNL